MGGRNRTILGGLLFLLFRGCTGAAGPLPAMISLPPLGRRCIHEEVAAGTEAVVELFVESGGKLEVHLTVEGPLTKGWGNVPEPSESTAKLLDAVVTNRNGEEGGEEDLSDSYLFSFTSQGGENGNVYQACVANDMNRLLSKTVQLDIRTDKAHPYFPAKRATPQLIENPDQGGGSVLTDAEKAAAADKEQEVANLVASVKRLKAGLRKLQGQQASERHRQAGHVAVHKDANDHMVGGSVVETLVFLAAAAFQLLFIRKWFDGKAGKKGRQWA